MMTTPTTPRRRWSFSLRTLLVVLTLAACWLGYQANWIRQRHAVINASQTDTFRCWTNYFDPFNPEAETPPCAPALLWVFGEPGYYNLHIEMEGPIAVRDKVEQAKADRIARLFPEARVEVVGNVKYLPK